MQRQIFVVAAQIVDANGTYNVLSGYPKAFDSHVYGDDVDKALARATGEYHNTLGPLYSRADRQLQTVMLMSADGMILKQEHIGAIADLPDPEPEPEPESET